MSYVQDLLSLDQRHMILGTGFFGATVAPGFLILYHFKPDLVNDWDFFKILLFSLSLTTPFVLLHYVQMRSYGLRTEEGVADYTSAAILACMTSLLSLHLALLGAYFLKWSFREFLIGVCLMTAFCYVIAWWDARSDKAKTTPPPTT